MLGRPQFPSDSVIVFSGCFCESISCVPLMMDSMDDRGEAQLETTGPWLRVFDSIVYLLFLMQRYWPVWGRRLPDGSFDIAIFRILLSNIRRKIICFDFEKSSRNDRQDGHHREDLCTFIMYATSVTTNMRVTISQPLRLGYREAEQAATKIDT